MSGVQRLGGHGRRSHRHSFFNVIFDYSERMSDSLGHLIKKNLAESVAKESVIKMFN